VRSGRLSLGFDAGALDHLGHTLGFVRNGTPECIRSLASRLHPERRKLWNVTIATASTAIFCTTAAGVPMRA
jgi:hypothetical protein